MRKLSSDKEITTFPGSVFLDYFIFFPQAFLSIEPQSQEVTATV